MYDELKLKFQRYYNKKKFYKILSKHVKTLDFVTVIEDKDYESELLIQKLTSNIKILSDDIYYFFSRDHTISLYNLSFFNVDIYDFHVNICGLSNYNPYYKQINTYHKGYFYFYISDYKCINFNGLNLLLDDMEFYIGNSWFGNYIF